MSPGGPVFRKITLQVVWTIGHSSRTMADLLALMKGVGIERVADVRRFPGSRAYPHFKQAALSESLQEHGISYFAFPELGGRRRPSPASVHTVWRNPAFRAYADYMDTAQFRAGLDRLVQVAAGGRTALLCSEVLWWRCHRAMIADALKARGWRVLHILGARQIVEHPLTSAARIVDGGLGYGAGPR